MGVALRKNRASESDIERGRLLTLRIATHIINVRKGYGVSLNDDSYLK